MDTDKPACITTKVESQRHRRRFSLRSLRLSLKYRPEILKLVLKMRHTIRMKNALLSKLERQLKNTTTSLNKTSVEVKPAEKEVNPAKVEVTPAKDEVNPAKVEVTPAKVEVNPAKDEVTPPQMNPRIDSPQENKDSNICDKNNSYTQTSPEEIKDCNLTNRKAKDTKDSYTQTDNLLSEENKTNNNIENVSSTAWSAQSDGDNVKSIADQVKEVAQSALQQNGMVYVETAGMYYDYKTGYYYNSELGLNYHTDTGCYYYYSDEKQTFVFHSYPENRTNNDSTLPREVKKATKQKKVPPSDDIDNLAKQLNQENEDGETKPKRRKIKLTKKKKEEPSKEDQDEKMETNEEETVEVKEENELESDVNKELEDGECSDTASEESDRDSDGSTSTDSGDESVAKHHPPCMRIIVKETSLPKLKVGSLYLITKDGGTIGREGDHHAIVLKEHNVSRNHLKLMYDVDARLYFAIDTGSKNGTILNGTRMTPSGVTGVPMQVIHGSTIQVGETKLLCHIHKGNDTCGHCEPGLIMEMEEKEKKVAYTRTCSVQKQHQLELARLKNKYAPKRLEIEETAYNDRAQARRDKFGSSHHSEKTQSSDINTFIAPENKGFKLLEKMGWSKGEGLGKDNQGDQEPIPLVSNEGKTGLGSTSEPKVMVSKTLGPATLRLAAKTNMLNPPAKAFQQEEEDSE